jgi:hypothetical protein
MAQTAAADEVTEVLEGYSNRCKELDIQPPEQFVADNCCHVRPAIVKVFPKTCVALDVYHFLTRCARISMDSGMIGGAAACGGKHWLYQSFRKQ